MHNIKLFIIDFRFRLSLGVFYVYHSSSSGPRYQRKKKVYFILLLFDILY